MCFLHNWSSPTKSSIKPGMMESLCVSCGLIRFKHDRRGPDWTRIFERDRLDAERRNLLIENQNLKDQIAKLSKKGKK